jgi:broad specificity phosphatase PhoE
VSGDVTLIRHGETQWSASGRHTGHTDVPLTDAGRREALLVGVALEGRRFDLVLCSPLGRATETCQLAGFGDDAEMDPDLREWDYGDYEGMTTDEISAERPGWSMWADGYPGGETIGDVTARADRVVQRCRAAEGEVALFAHGHVLRVLGARWILQPTALGGKLLLSTASISKLGWEHGSPVITSWNDVAHLR